MSSWASFQRRYEKLTAELRRETSESQRKQLSAIGNNNPVPVVVYPVSHLPAASPPDPPLLHIHSSSSANHIHDHRPLTPSPSPSEVLTCDARNYGPHVSSLHVRDLTVPTASTETNTNLFNNNVTDSNNSNTNNSVGSSPSPGSLLTPPASKSISKSPSPNCEALENNSSCTTSSTTATNSSSPFSRSFFGGRFSLGKAGIGYRTLGLPQFLANLSIGSSSASNSNISNNRTEGERRASTSSGTGDPVSASEVVKTAETVNRIMDTQCLSPRPVRPRPKDLRGLGPMGGSGRSSGRLRQDLSFLPSSPARSATSAHHRHSPANQQDREDSMRLSNKFPSNNTLTIDGQVSYCSVVTCPQCDTFFLQVNNSQTPFHFLPICHAVAGILNLRTGFRRLGFAGVGIVRERG